MRITRHVMYHRIFEVLPLPLSGSILGISGLKYFLGSKNYTPTQKVIADTATITNADFPEINVTKLPYADNSFDAVIADQVMEHVEGSIEQAFTEMHRVLKPGGLLIVTSVFIQPVHWGPKDLWRFSPDAFRYLARNFSSIVECGSWGNRWAHILFFLYDKARNWQVPERRFSIMSTLARHNDQRYPLTTWIIARK
jgi:SAM-dependent methyltransferase